MRKILFVFIVFSLFSCKKNNDDLYIEYIKQYDESIKLYERRSNEILKKILNPEIEDSILSPPPKFYREYVEVSKKFNGKTEMILNDIDSIKREICSSEILKIINYKRLKGETYILGKNVRHNFQEYIKIVNYQHEITHTELRLCDSTLLNKVFGITKNWEKLFEYVNRKANVLELLAVLLKIESEIERLRLNFYARIYSRIDSYGYTYAHLQSVFSYETGVISLGDVYEANICFANTYISIDRKIKINSKEIPIKERIGKYKKRITEKPGNYIDKGEVLFKNLWSGDTVAFPFEIKYRVK